MYFGLDFLISVWILTERFVKKTKPDNMSTPPYDQWIGYVHVFKTKKDIRYDYLWEDGCVPEDCTASKEIYEHTPIIHPQVAFHEGFNGDNELVELGTEMTIPNSKRDLDDSLEYIGYHVIDITKLFIYRTESLIGWQPHDAIKKSISFRKTR